VASDLDPAIAAHYRHDPERDRLETWARLEGIRTRELLDRFLPKAPAVVLDIGGARGAYALGLAREGYEVHLVDPYVQPRSARFGRLPLSRRAEPRLEGRGQRG
jgi:hypothetical protein